MANARAASEPPHMARYSGSVYFCFPCPAQRWLGRSPALHPQHRAGGAETPPLPPPAAPSTHLAVQKRLHLAVLGLVVVPEDNLAPAQPQLCILGLGDLRVHRAQPLHVACEREPSSLLPWGQKANSPPTPPPPGERKDAEHWSCAEGQWSCGGLEHSGVLWGGDPGWVSTADGLRGDLTAPGRGPGVGGRALLQVMVMG